MEYTLMLLASNTSFRDLSTSLYAFVCRGLRGLRIDKAVVGAGIRQRLAWGAHVPETERPPSRQCCRNSIRCFDQATTIAAAFFRFLRYPSRPPSRRGR